MVAWGIFILVILLGMGTGLGNGVEAMFDDEATNSIWVWSGQTSVAYKGLPEKREIRLTNADLDAVLANVDSVDNLTSRFFIQSNVIVNRGKENGNYNVQCVLPGYDFIENMTATQGRFLNENDVRNRAKVTCIGRRVAEGLFKKENPIGQYIQINGIPFRVIGIFKAKGWIGEEERVFIPVSTGQRVFRGNDEIHSILFTVGESDLAESERIIAQTREILSQRHRFDPKDQRALWVNNNLEEFEKFQGVIRAIKVFVGVIGILTLLAGVVGVGNIMLIVVKERTREIGVRKAMGATPWNVIRMILIESLLLTSLAGYIGLILGLLTLEGVSLAVGDGADYFKNPNVNLQTALFAVVTIVVAGLIAGAIPAIKAARIRPIEALRDE